MTINNDILDLSNLIENSMGDDSFVTLMLSMFLEQGGAQIENLSTLCVDGENKDWVEVAHALKGTAASGGAMYMRSLCADAQNMVAATGDQRQKMVTAIQTAYDQAVAEILKSKYRPEN